MRIVSCSNPMGHAGCGMRYGSALTGESCGRGFSVFSRAIVGAAMVIVSVASVSRLVAAGEGNSTSAIPRELKEWLQPQDWKRDTAGPILQLGEPGEFDDTHLFAPCVTKLDDLIHLWYSGSTGVVANRVFDLGLATSVDGRVFEKHAGNPVFQFGDGKHSVLTATLLRNPDGSVLRDDGQLRMWFSSTHFSEGSGHHALYETTSTDGLSWSEPSPRLQDHVYAPTILREGNEYRWPAGIV